MPTIVPPECWARWLNGAAEEAATLCCAWPGSLQIERTCEPWAKPPDVFTAKLSPTPSSQPHLGVVSIGDLAANSGQAAHAGKALGDIARQSGQHSQAI